MKAIILAAGRGSRMSAMTEDRPKCLLELAGKTLLEWQASALKQAGVSDIVIIGGYRRGDLPQDGFILLENPRWPETNMVGTLLYAQKYLSSEECLVSYADIVYHPEIVQKLMFSQGDVVITYDRQWFHLWKERFLNPLEDAESFCVDAEANITDIGRKTSELNEIQGQYMGLLKFAPGGWHSVKGVLQKLTDQEKDRLDMTSLLRLLVRKGYCVKGVPIEGKWCEVDNPRDIELYQRKILNDHSLDSCWGHDWRWQTKEDMVRSFK